MNKMYYEPVLTNNDIIERLLALDEEVYLLALKENVLLERKIEMILVGSTCLALRNASMLRTDDIDIYRISNSMDVTLLQKYDMNTSSSMMHSFMPYNFEDRVEKIELKTKVIDYYLMSLEDIIICKLVADRQKDRDNIEHESLIKRIDWEKLKVSAREVRLSINSAMNWEFFKARYNDYVRRYHHEEVVIEDLY